MDKNFITEIHFVNGNILHFQCKDLVEENEFILKFSCGTQVYVIMKANITYMITKEDK